MEDELGIWNFIHGTGAGCASIVAWEGAHIYLSEGAAVIVFTGVTFGIMHLVHLHRRRLSQRRHPRPQHGRPEGRQEARVVRVTRRTRRR